MSDLFIKVIDYISLGVGVAGILIVIYGVIMAVVDLIKLEFSRVKKSFI